MFACVSVTIYIIMLPSGGSYKISYVIGSYTSQYRKTSIQHHIHTYTHTMHMHGHTHTHTYTHTQGANQVHDFPHEPICTQDLPFSRFTEIPMAVTR